MTETASDHTGPVARGAPGTPAGSADRSAPDRAVELLAPTADAMRALGHQVADAARAGDLLILSGPLGAGKTTFTQGLGEGLGVRGRVTSPTFVISRIHPSLTGRPALVHVDAYRLGSAEEVDDLDLDASLPDSVTVVEWGEDVAEELSDDRLEISIDRRPDDTRSVRLTAVGPRWADAITGLG